MEIVRRKVDRVKMIDSFNTIAEMINFFVDFAQHVTFNQDKTNKSLPSGHLNDATLGFYRVV